MSLHFSFERPECVLGFAQKVFPHEGRENEKCKNLREMGRVLYTQAPHENLKKGLKTSQCTRGAEEKELLGRTEAVLMQSSSKGVVGVLGFWGDRPTKCTGGGSFFFPRVKKITGPKI